jgi:hypothetical protein
VAGTILVAGITTTPGRSYALAMAVLAAVGLVGFIMALLLPRSSSPSAVSSDPKFAQPPRN